MQNRIYVNAHYINVCVVLVNILYVLTQVPSRLLAALTDRMTQGIKCPTEKMMTRMTNPQEEEMLKSNAGEFLLYTYLMSRNSKLKCFLMDKGT